MGITRNGLWQECRDIAGALVQGLGRGALRGNKLAAPLLAGNGVAGRAPARNGPQLISDDQDTQVLDEASHYKEVAFTLASIALCAKLIQCDGPINKSEYAAFRKAFPMPATEKEKVWRLFCEAAQDVQGPAYYARQIRQLYVGRRALLEDVLSRLFAIAVADRRLHDAELAVLRTIASALGVTQSRFHTVMRRHVCPPSSNPYETLGVLPQVDNNQLKAAYRRLMREYHPDGLAAYGVSEDMLVIAAARVRQINEAYDKILRMRGLK